VTDIAHRLTASTTQRLRSQGALLALGLVLCAAFVPAQRALAQNLVLDPYFANGVPANGSSDTAGNGYQTNFATATTFDGVTGVLLAGNSNAYFQIDPLAGYDNNGATYTFTFLAAVTNPDAATSLNGAFGPAIDPQCSDCGNAIVTEFVNSTGLTQYSLTATSTAQFGNFSYLYVQNSGSADVFVTGLDFESQGAPAPLPGTGIFSACAAFAALAFHRLRGRAA